MTKLTVDEIKDFLLSKSQFKSFGIFEGDSCRLLLSSIAGNFFKDEELLIFSDKLLKSFFIRLNQNDLSDISFGYGLGGLAWSINYLIENNYYNDNAIDRLGFDQIIKSRFRKKGINPDFLSGDLSMAIFFLERFQFHEELAEIVNWLNKSSEKFGYPHFTTPLRKKRFRRRENAQYYGIAHGLAGALIVLAKIKNSGVEPKTCDSLIKKIIEHFVEINESVGKYRFPVLKTERNVSWTYAFSWCHGDFGIGYSVYLTGIILGNKEYKKLGLEIIDMASSKSDLNEKYLKSLFFCHGKVGILHMYNRLAEFSGIEKYKNCAYSLYENIDFEKAKSEKAEQFPANGLLLGYDGFLLSRLCFENEITPNWDSCLLLS